MWTPGQQHGRRIPSLSSEHTLFTCCRLVSSFLTEMVQQIHSLRARRYVFPRGACPGVGRERLSKIIWEVMNDSSRHLNSCHRGISPVLAFAPILALAEQDSSLQGDCGRLGSSNFLPLGKTPGELLASETLNMQLPSIQVRNLIETAVLQIQHSPDLSEEEVRWIQQFAAHLITEFSVLKEPDLLYAPVEDDTSADQHGQPMNRVGTL